MHACNNLVIDTSKTDISCVSTTQISSPQNIKQDKNICFIKLIIKFKYLTNKKITYSTQRGNKSYTYTMPFYSGTPLKLQTLETQSNHK